MTQISKLFSILEEKIKKDKLILPTLPKIALKVRKACDDVDTTVDDMVKILSQDPALSARMIKFANSAFIKRQGTRKITELDRVVGRIGLDQIRNIATSMAMEQLFISNHSIIKEYIQNSWEKTVKVAACATALMNIYKEDNRRSELNSNNMLLLGLIHNIGVLPILTEAESQEKDLLEPEKLSYCIDKYSSIIGVTILKNWEFTEEFTNVVKNCFNFSYNTKTISYIDFIRASLYYNDMLTSEVNKEELTKDLIFKGVIEDINIFESDYFEKQLCKVSNIFN